MAEKRPIPSLLPCEINFLKVYSQVIKQVVLPGKKMKYRLKTEKDLSVFDPLTWLIAL